MTTRNLPTLANTPSGVSGEDYAAAVNASVAALWGATGGVITITSGATDTLTATATVSSGLSAYSEPLICTFIPTNTNAGACTINIQGLGAKAIKRRDGTPLQAGDLTVDVIAQIAFIQALDYFVLLTGSLSTGAATSSSASFEHFEILTGSGTWTTPYDCRVRFHLIGATGSPARLGNTYVATGAGGGGHCIHDAIFDADTAFTYSVGTKGAAGSLNADGVAASGPTTLTDGGDVSLTANPGEAGNFGSSGLVVAAQGGAASGGNIGNYTGGNSGEGTDSSSYRLPGGGAVGLQADGGNGGNRNSSDGGAGGGGQSDAADEAATAGAGFPGDFVLGGMLSVGDGAGEAGTSTKGGDGFGIGANRYGGGNSAEFGVARTGTDGVIIVFYSAEIV